MRRSIATVCLSGGLREKLQAIAAAGFDAVEIFENDLLNFDGAPADVRRMAEDLGLQIALYQPFRDFEAMPADLFARNLDRAERKFDVMEALGAPMMLVCSNTSPAAIDDEALAARQLRELASRAGRRGLKIGYEALAWGRHVRHVDQVWRIVQQADHPHLGVLLDSFHMLALGDDPAMIRAIPGDKIFFVQIADAPRMSLDPLSWSRHYRCFPGQGQLDVSGFVQEVIEAGYTGPLSLEIFNDDFRGGAARQIARDGLRSLRFLEETVTNARKAAPPTERRVALFDPPAPTRLSGVSFLEFAVDDAAGLALGDWLQRFGFERIGRHRHKSVSLYRSGAVNLVLNGEVDSFAHSYFLLHGPAICAIGLRTDDAVRALGRATDYGCARFEGRAGPNDLSIPAVRALDGSLIYFVDQTVESGGLYEIEFDLKPAAPAEPAPSAPTGVDHVAIALPTGQMDSWVLYYRAVLGLEAMETFVLPDPYGLVRSRAVVDKDRTVRFPLNISLGRETTTARSISSQFGAGVHHIAFDCDDVLAMAERLKAIGAPILDIPQNYYDDLIARFALDPAMVDRLQHLNVLYDRVGDGEFLHLYSATFQGRFFLEYVQRLGGYDDYGAPNAPVRMAAHTRLVQVAP